MVLKMQESMMSFEDFERLYENEKRLYIKWKNEQGETVILDRGIVAGERFFRTTVVQPDTWMRVNVYWEDGHIEELYER